MRWDGMGWDGMGWDGVTSMFVGDLVMDGYGLLVVGERF